ncbi:MAG: XRE family transcriptional regulator [Hyphomicrobium sp.]|nr:XRE family transcriptional regulator [Hyphomicrobium sp.]
MKKTAATSAEFERSSRKSKLLSANQDDDDGASQLTRPRPVIRHDHTGETTEFEEFPVQDPHALSGARDNALEVAIGREVRAFRKKLGITVSDLARATGLSLGMLSKIENGVTSASLTTLQRLSRALGVPVTALFRRFEEKRDAVFVSAGQGLVIERRGTRAGHQYELLGHTGSASSGVVVEPYLITLTEESDVFPLFQHAGLEFLYMLEGEVVYRHADRLYTMKPGDSLFFDADAPHGPEELVKLPIRFLSVISYPRNREDE